MAEKCNCGHEKESHSENVNGHGFCKECRSIGKGECGRFWAVTVRLNLGAGRQRKEGYKSVDYDEDSGADFVCDLNVLPWRFENDSIEEIYTKDCVEHLWLELPDFVSEVKRILKPNGTIEILTHNHFFYKHRISYFLGVFRQEQGWHLNHSFLIKTGELKNFLELNGFEVTIQNTSRFLKPLEKLCPNLFCNYTHLIARLRP